MGQFLCSVQISSLRRRVIRNVCRRALFASSRTARSRRSASAQRRSKSSASSRVFRIDLAPAICRIRSCEPDSSRRRTHCGGEAGAGSGRPGTACSIEPGGDSFGAPHRTTATSPPVEREALERESLGPNPKGPMCSKCRGRAWWDPKERFGEWEPPMIGIANRPMLTVGWCSVPNSLADLVSHVNLCVEIPNRRSGTMRSTGQRRGRLARPGPSWAEPSIPRPAEPIGSQCETFQNDGGRFSVCCGTLM